MKKKGLVIAITIVFILISSCSIYVFIGSKNIQNKMRDYLDSKGYTKKDIISVDVKHSFLNIVLSYNEWKIKVIYADEITSIYSYYIKDGKIVEGGVSGTTNKEDLKH